MPNRKDFIFSIFFAPAKRDIATSQLRYDINPLTPRRAYRVQSTYRTALRYIANPNRIYIAANKKLPSEEGSFIVSN